MRWNSDGVSTPSHQKRSQNASPSSPANERKATRSGGLQSAAEVLASIRRFSLNINQKNFRPLAQVCQIFERRTTPPNQTNAAG
jgi:hypothetical protein